MNKILFLLLLCLLPLAAQGQSGEDYNPQNPPDPESVYMLKLETAPLESGTVNSGGRLQLNAGQQCEITTSPRLGYEFKQWMEGNVMVSDAPTFIYTMPERNVVLTAYYEWTGNYNPENPGDPDAEGYSHKVRIYASPSIGGYFNNASFTLVEGKTETIYAYPRQGYRFESWMKDNKVVSTDNPMTIRMGTADVAYTAAFAYDPANPSSPGANAFDATSGELVIDDFEAGNLNQCIAALVDVNSYDKVKSVTVIGTMESSDFGFSRDFSACETVDCSRTTGYWEIPSYSFQNVASLQTVCLPANVEQVGTNAFNGCSNLKEIYLYASNPPRLDENALAGLDKTVTVYVPAASVSLYRKAEGWKYLNIQSLDKNEKTITVNLPGENGKYKNMMLELQNIMSGQVNRYLVTDHTSYTFYGLIKNTSYNVYLKNSAGIVLAEIKNLLLNEEDLTVSFSSIKSMRNVTLLVRTPDGKVVTPDVSIVWYDDKGGYLRQGSTVPDLLSGSTVKYTVTLNEELALKYLQPTEQAYMVADGSNSIVCNLSPLKSVVISGFVKDGDGGVVVSNASVSLSQTLNGKYAKTTAVKTDNNGYFWANVFNAPTTLDISAFNYITQTRTLDINPESTQIHVDDIELKSMIGANINIQHSFTPSVEEGETTEVQMGYDDYLNVIYDIYDITADKELKLFSLINGQLLIYEDVKPGDRIRITATSKKDAFIPVIKEFTYENTSIVNVTIPIVQYGGIKASFKHTENSEVVGVLYNSYGYRIGTYDFDKNATLYLPELKDGDYSLVVLGKNPYANSVYMVGQYTDLGLVENTDYCKRPISVISGTIISAEFPTIPQFNEERIKLVKSIAENSAFTADKSWLVAGNYLTFNGKISIPDEYSDLMKNLEMTIELPSTAKFVDNSLIVGNSQGTYSLDGNKVTIRLDKALSNERVRFCVIPTEAGKFFPNAFLDFNIDNEKRTVGLGHAYYAVDSLDIIVPGLVKKKSAKIMGAALPGSEIIVYDNDNVVGRTTTPADGQWSVNCDLANAYNLSSHPIYAKVIIDGIETLSVTKKCLVDKDAQYVKTVTMSYHNQDVVFDLENGMTTPSNYSYSSGTDYTFSINFLNNNPSNVSFVYLFAFDYYNRVTKIKATYDEKTDKWVAKHYFDDSNAPVNVSVDYVYQSTNELDVSPVDNSVADLQQELEEEDSLSNIIESKIEELDKELDSEKMTAEQFEKKLDEVYILFGLTPTSEIIYEPPLVDWENLDDDEKIKEVEKERSKRENEPSDDYKQIEKELTSSIQQTITQSGEIINITSSQPILDDNYNINIAGTNWSTGSPTSSVVSFTNGNSGRIEVNMEADLPTPADNDDAYHEWGARAQILASEWTSYGVSTANSVLSAAQTVVTQEIARCSREIIFDHVFIKNLLSYEPDRRFINRNLYRPLLDDMRAEHFKRRAAKKLGANIKHISNIGGVAGAFMGVWSVGSDIRNGLDINNNWNRLIKLINDCDDPRAPALAQKADDYKRWIRNRYVAKGTVDVANTVVGGASNFVAPGPSLLINLGGLGVSLITNHWERQYTQTNRQNWQTVVTEYETFKCDEDDDDEDIPEPLTRPVSISWDPAGYVYEGVSSNRLEGVKTTAFFQETVTDQNGVVRDEAILWDASEYGQMNPLFTDKQGMYRWDVPQGLWLVKYEKEGYETAYSEWLPVPPPQLEVNVGMVQLRQPDVKLVHAFKDGITIEFDKYMLPDLLNTSTIFVVQNGEYVEGEIVLLDDEIAYDDENVKYASKLRFVPETPFTAKEVTLTVLNHVKCYAGLQMQNNYQQTFDIEQEPMEIAVDSVINMTYGESSVVNVAVLPKEAGAGKTLVVSPNQTKIADTESSIYTLDENGEVGILINANIPGSTFVTYSLKDYDLSASTSVNVDAPDYETCGVPIASIASGSEVEKGTTVSLSSLTEGAVIYYTLDGSCPCNNTDARKLYDGTPIEIGEDVVIKAIAVADKMYESDVAEFIYIAKDPVGIDLLTDDCPVRIYPLPVRTTLNVSVGGRLIKGVIISNMNGVVVRTSDKTGQKVTLNVADLPAGTYIVNVQTENGTYSQKVLKVK